ncbi:MAG: hypothetical protein CMF25_03890 [Kangiellaceae bacterium]|nr:hypothetical protein [Kangiellaceae bacterium]
MKWRYLLLVSWFVSWSALASNDSQYYPQHWQWLSVQQVTELPATEGAGRIVMLPANQPLRLELSGDTALSLHIGASSMNHLFIEQELHWIDNDSAILPASSHNRLVLVERDDEAASLTLYRGEMLDAPSPEVKQSMALSLPRLATIEQPKGETWHSYRLDAQQASDVVLDGPANYRFRLLVEQSYEALNGQARLNWSIDSTTYQHQWQPDFRYRGWTGSSEGRQRYFRPEYVDISVPEGQHRMTFSSNRSLAVSLLRTSGEYWLKSWNQPLFEPSQTPPGEITDWRERLFYRDVYPDQAVAIEPRMAVPLRYRPTTDMSGRGGSNAEADIALLTPLHQQVLLQQLQPKPFLRWDSSIQVVTKIPAAVSQARIEILGIPETTQRFHVQWSGHKKYRGWLLGQEHLLLPAAVSSAWKVRQGGEFSHQAIIPKPADLPQQLRLTLTPAESFTPQWLSIGEGDLRPLRLDSEQLFKKSQVLGLARALAYWAEESRGQASTDGIPDDLLAHWQPLLLMLGQSYADFAKDIAGFAKDKDGSRQIGLSLAGYKKRVTTLLSHHHDYLALQLLRGCVLSETDGEHYQWCWQRLYDYYQQYEIGHGIRGILVADIVRKGRQSNLSLLASHLIEEGQFHLAMDILVLLPASSEVNNMLLALVVRQQQYGLYRQLEPRLSNDERRFWDGLMALARGDTNAAVSRLRSSRHSQAAAWLNWLERYPGEESQRLEWWWTQQPSRFYWGSELDGVAGHFERGLLENVPRLTTLQGGIAQQVSLTMNGPAQLRWTLRPYHTFMQRGAGLYESNDLLVSFHDQHDTTLEQVIFSSAPSDLVVRGKKDWVGVSKSVSMQLKEGRSEVTLHGHGQQLWFELDRRKSLLLEPVKSTLFRNAMDRKAVEPKELIVSGEYLTEEYAEPPLADASNKMPLVGGGIAGATPSWVSLWKKLSENMSLQPLVDEMDAKALRHWLNGVKGSPLPPEHQQFMRWLDQRFDWEKLAAIELSAGLLSERLPALSAESARGDMWQLMHGGLRKNERRLASSSELHYQLSLPEAEKFRLVNRILAIPYRDNPNALLQISRGSMGSIGQSLNTTSRPWRLDAGKHVVQVGLDSNEDLAVAVKLQHLVEGQWQDLVTTAQRSWHVTTVEEPLSFWSDAGQIIRIDYGSSAQRERRYLMRAEAGSVEVPPRKGFKQDTVRIFKLVWSQRRFDGLSERDEGRFDRLSERDEGRFDGLSERDEGRFDGLSERDERRFDRLSEREMGLSEREVAIADAQSLPGKNGTPGAQLALVSRPDAGEDQVNEGAFERYLEMTWQWRQPLAPEPFAGQPLRLDILGRLHQEGEPLIGARLWLDSKLDVLPDWQWTIHNSTYLQPVDFEGSSLAWSSHWSVSGQRFWWLAPQWRHQLTGRIFARYLDVDSDDYREVDRDIATPYLHDHRSGAGLASRLEWLAYEDSRALFQLHLQSNEFNQGLSGDYMRLTTSWRQLLGRADVEASWQYRRYFNDQDRQSTSEGQRLMLDWQFWQWQSNSNLWRWKIDALYDLDASEWGLMLGIGWYPTSGRLLRDFRSQELRFGRQRQWDMLHSVRPNAYYDSHYDEEGGQ